MDDDGILVHPSLTRSERRLGDVVAHELAYMLHPNCEDPSGDHGEMERFASELAPMVLATSPDYPMIDVAFMASRQ